jgi:hypothetical protein
MHDALDLVIGHACTDSEAGDGEGEGSGGGEAVGRWGKSRFTIWIQEIFYLSE